MKKYSAESIENWAIVYTQKATYVGEVISRPGDGLSDIHRLAGAYEWVGVQQIRPDGSVDRGFRIIPVEGLALDGAEVQIQAFSVAIRIGALSQPDRRVIADALSQAVEQFAHARAQRSGILLAGNGALSAGAAMPVPRIPREQKC